ncbi:MAG: hypothetical protein LBG27_03640 [Spirochaetaceae bacterium]|nr:hypothetical protein [Spirochaetaceae bacterium]
MRCWADLSCGHLGPGRLRLAEPLLAVIRGGYPVSGAGLEAFFAEKLVVIVIPSIHFPFSIPVGMGF